MISCSRKQPTLRLQGSTATAHFRKPSRTCRSLRSNDSFRPPQLNSLSKEKAESLLCRTFRNERFDCTQLLLESTIIRHTLYVEAFESAMEELDFLAPNTAGTGNSANLSQDVRAPLG